MKTNLVTLALTSLLCAAPVSSDSIIMQRSIRMKHADSRITLADIARLEGSQATKYGSLVIERFENRSRPMTVTVEEVTKALDRAGVNWAQVELSGGTAVVRPYSGQRMLQADPQACAPMELEQRDSGVTERETSLEGPLATTRLPVLTIDPKKIVNEDTPRGLIAMRLAELWRDCVKPVRMHLQTTRTSLLDEPGLRPRVTVLGRIANGTGRFKVVMEDEGVIEVEAYLEVERLSHRAKGDLMRGDRINHKNLESKTDWIRLEGARDPRAGLDIILGGTLDRNVRAGMVFETRDFVPTIQRHDPIKVRSGSTGFNLTLDCVSLEDGHVGDTIQVKPDVPGPRSQNDKVIRVVILDANNAETLN